MTFFTPYVEAYEPRVTQPGVYDSGSNTTLIDAFRQGVEVTTEKQKFSGILPKIGSNDIDHELDVVTYGQSSEFRADTNFEEILPFNPITFINNQDALIYPVLLGNTAVLDPERFGGYIEPLSRGTRDLLLSTTEFQPNDVRGMIMGGNEDVFRKTNLISERFKRTVTIAPDDLYIDAASNFGASGSISLPGYFPETEKLIEPYSDRLFLNRSLSIELLPSSSEDLKTALIAMSGSSDIYVQSGYYYGSTGHLADSDNNVIDSIAFRGLLR